MNILISIIIPVYNVEKYLESCMESIIYQDLESCEVILINDGSSDSSGSLCDKYVSSNIRVYHRDNVGLSGTRNFGISIAKGDYLLFVDSDDVIAPNSLSVLKHFIKEKEPDIIKFGITLYYDEEKKSNKYLKRLNILSPISGGRFFLCSYFSKTYYPAACGYCFKANLLSSPTLRFEEGYIHEDEAFTQLILLKSKYLISLNKNIYYYRQRLGSITKNVSYNNVYGLLRAYGLLKKSFHINVFFYYYAIRLFFRAIMIAYEIDKGSKLLFVDNQVVPKNKTIIKLTLLLCDIKCRILRNVKAK